jgi:hypothetical protein
MSLQRAFFLLLPLVLLACQIFTPPPAPATPTPIALADISFDDPLTQERFTSLDRCLAEFATGPDWRHIPYTRGGNFIRTKWCRGAGALSDCQITFGNQNRHDQHSVELYTLQYGNDLSHAFGLGLSARWVPPQTGWVPPQTGWGAALYFAEGGQTVVGEGFSVSFMEYGAEEVPVNELHFGMINEYKIGETTLSYPAQLPLRDELALYIASPESLLAQGQAVLSGLEDVVQSALDAHAITTCDYGPYNGDGIPPACYPRPLTGEEAQAARAEAARYFANQQAVLAGNYEAMYEALGVAFPFEGCWE